MPTLIAATAPTSSTDKAPLSATAIEYVTRDLFKGKSLRAASKAFHRRFSGEDNIFLGRVTQSIEEIMQAILSDKAALAIQNARRMKVGNAHIAIEGTAQQFNLEVGLLATEVMVQLACADPAAKTDGPDPVARAVFALNAAHPDAPPLAPHDGEAAEDGMSACEEEPALGDAPR
ncbi:hypothetical protein LJR175_008270 [Variovorax sp. LjRoot175]|uniref:hypothetical protein n=1 Tax=Variovorax sp. LjRoot175 TaxID=3342276 RepID=UPI003ED14D84